MCPSLRLDTTRRLLAALLLTALVVGCADRGPPSSDELTKLSGPAVHDLIMEQHNDRDQGVCGTLSQPDYEDDENSETRPHGLDATSEVPAGAIAAIEERGANLDDYEQRHFDTHRLLLISWDRTSADLGPGYDAELGSVFELYHEVDLRDGSAIWYIVFTGSVLECPPDWPD